MREDALHHTVLVLGAGASADFGFPIGSDLMAELRRLLTDGSTAPFRDMLKEACKGADLQPAARAISWTKTRSIDQFLAESEPNVRRIIKTGMAYLLLSGERGFAIRHLSTWNGSWYDHFYERLRDGGSWRRGVTVLTFNYDRSLPLYLCRILSSERQVRGEPMGLPAGPVPIHHVHGALGPTEATGEWWHTDPEFPNAAMSSAAAEGVYLYNEHRQSEMINRVREIVSDAGQLVFLGFGFHRQNLEALGLMHGGGDLPDRIVASRFKMSPEEFTRADQLLKSKGINVDWAEEKHGCLEVLQDLPELGFPG